MNQLQQLLEAVGLPRVSTEIIQVALPSIRLKAHPIEEIQLKQGTTTFGGVPDLSVTDLWPECDGVPLPFVAQINLPEVASYDPMHLLPDRGLLSFFFDIDAFFGSWPRRQSTWRVMYDPSALTTLQRVAIPDTIVRRRRYRPSTVTCSTEITLPDYSQYDPISVERLGLSRPLPNEEEQAYYAVQAQLAGTAGTQHHIPLHRLLGHPNDVQWDMYRDLDGSPNDWQLLFQMDSDDIPDTAWGDTGRIYYWIRTRDLAKGDFSKVALILQST